MKTLDLTRRWCNAILILALYSILTYVEKILDRFSVSWELVKNRTSKLIGISFEIREFSPDEQFSCNELRS